MPAVLLRGAGTGRGPPTSEEQGPIFRAWVCGQWVVSCRKRRRSRRTRRRTRRGKRGGHVAGARRVNGSIVFHFPHVFHFHFHSFGSWCEQRTSERSNERTSERANERTSERCHSPRLNMASRRTPAAVAGGAAGSPSREDDAGGGGGSATPKTALIRRLRQQLTVRSCPSFHTVIVARSLLLLTLDRARPLD